MKAKAIQFRPTFVNPYCVRIVSGAGCESSHPFETMVKAKAFLNGILIGSEISFARLEEGNFNDRGEPLSRHLCTIEVIHEAQARTHPFCTQYVRGGFRQGIIWLEIPESWKTFSGLLRPSQAA